MLCFPEAHSAKPNSASNAHPGKRRHRANTGAPPARFHRTHGTGDKRCCRPREPALSLCRHPRDDGERGSITAGMRQAGEDFRDRFAVAQLDPLKAFDISRPRTGNSAGFKSAAAPSSRIEEARKLVWDAIVAVGGLGSAGGSCIWHVVGWQQSLKEWALEQGWNGRRVSQEMSVMIAATPLR